MSTRRQPEAGFTLVELLVVMVLLGVVGSVVTSAIVSGVNSARTTSARTHAIHELEVALQRVGRELRVADPLYLTTGTDYDRALGAEIVRSGEIRIVRFSVEDPGNGEPQELVQEVTVFDLATFVNDPANATPAEQPRRVLVTAIDNGIEPVFRYFDDSDQEIVCVPGVDGETKATCDNRYAAAAQIGVRFVRALEGQQPLRAETRISVRNTRYGGSSS
jgi:prepilin-type N-terminal cleavage/methylation domain-containing protein